MVLKQELNLYSNKIISFVMVVILPLVTIIAVIYFWSYVQLIDVILLLSMAFITGASVTIGNHRYFAHHAFKCKSWLENILIIFASMAGVGSVCHFVRIHRFHHYFADKPGDPHSPNLLGFSKYTWKRFLFAHMGWLFTNHCVNYSLQRNGGRESDIPPAVFQKIIFDLEENSKLMKLDRLYGIWFLLGLAIPGIIGGLWTQSLMGVWMGILWGGLLRMLIVANMVMYTISLGHLIGTKTFLIYENSRDNWFLNILLLGEGGHNSHHRFSSSARIGIQWWQIDIGYYIIWTLSKFGIVWDIKLPQIKTELNDQNVVKDNV